jgi:hypothetical protein
MDPFQIVRMGPLQENSNWIGPIRRLGEGLLLGRLVDLAIAEGLADRRPECQRGALEGMRDQRQADFVEVVPGDDRQARGFGIPFFEVLPSAARPNIVSISCSNAIAGRTSQVKRASPSPALQNLWAVRAAP